MAASLKSAAHDMGAWRAEALGNILETILASSNSKNHIKNKDSCTSDMKSHMKNKDFVHQI